jgi:hypothetical protein
MAMAMTVCMNGHLRSCVGIQKEMCVEDLTAVQAHEASSEEEHATDTQRSQALYFAKTSRKQCRRWLQTP